MDADLSLNEMQKTWKGTLKSYLIGFITCILLTAASFLLVITRLFSEHILIYIVIGLAITQAIVQSLFFLHVGQEEKPRWETVVFCFMLLILSIVVVGTVWVMNDLNNRMMMGMHD